jgi:hypothetical protein
LVAAAAGADVVVLLPPDFAADAFVDFGAAFSVDLATFLSALSTVLAVAFAAALDVLALAGDAFAANGAFFPAGAALAAFVEVAAGFVARFGAGIVRRSSGGTGGRDNASPG